jgi:hypothetical protein
MIVRAFQTAQAVHQCLAAAGSWLAQQLFLIVITVVH